MARESVGLIWNANFELLAKALEGKAPAISGGKVC
jgi:hypothetical protein